MKRLFVILALVMAMLLVFFPSQVAQVVADDAKIGNFVTKVPRQFEAPTGNGSEGHLWGELEGYGYAIELEVVAICSD